MNKVSVIIPVYNEQEDIKNCLQSLFKQTHKDIEIIAVDDGSNDRTKSIVKSQNVKLIEQSHKGPGVARNFGAKKAKGEILIFVDADMTFDKNFVKDLIQPIISGKAVGTFSKNEFVSNPQNPWSYAWNINRNAPRGKMLPDDYPNEAPVYRAILKKEFDKIGGFDTTGDYTDDWSLSEKLGGKSSISNGAVYFHRNPSTLKEVWHQASWIGKNKFLTSTFLRKFKSLILYCPPVSLSVAVFKSLRKLYPPFIVFKLIYDFSVFLSVLKSFSNTPKFK